MLCEVRDGGPEENGTRTPTLTKSVRLAVKDALTPFDGGVSMTSLAGLSALLGKAGLRSDTPLAGQEGLGEPVTTGEGGTTGGSDRG